MVTPIAIETYASRRARFGMLHAHRFLFRVGLSIANVFAWIFVFQYFYFWTLSIPGALVITVVMYCVAQIVTIILAPVSASHLRRGIKHSLVFGAVVAGAAFIYLGATLSDTLNGEPIGWGIVVFAILLGAYRALYWVPYQLGATSDGARSRLPIVYELVIAFMPAFAGATMVSFPEAPQSLLYGASVFCLLSLFPILNFEDLSERFEWGYFETFNQFYAIKHRRLLAASFTQGIQGATLFLLWPIAVYLIVGSDYQTLGAIVSATLVVSVIWRGYYRRLAQRAGIEHSTSVNVAFSVFGWMLRFFAGTPVAVFLADSYSHISSPRPAYIIDALTFEQASDSGSFIDEYTVLKEIGLALGRIGICVLFALLLGIFSIQIAFAFALILTAVASGASVIMERNAGISVL